MKNLIRLVALIGILISQLPINTWAQVGSQIPLDATGVPQFVDPLPHFAGKRVNGKTGSNITIKMLPHQQVALSTGTVLENGTIGVDPGAGVGNYWVYSISSDGVHFSDPQWPSCTIEAERGVPLNVTYENDLYGQTYSDENLIVDQTIHWADPLGLMMGDGDMDPYTGEVPTVVHLHGGEVPSESDGHPNAWFTPGYNLTGPVWGQDGTDQNYYYPNSQQATTLWFHDHTLGVTRLNVYAGLAGEYFIRGGQSEDALHLPGWTGDGKVRERPLKGAGSEEPGRAYLPEIELILQDRSFDTYGQLYFLNDPPNPLIHPYWTPEFFGDVITVNGKSWPYLSVAPRRYRFRILNASNARFFELWLERQGPGSNTDDGNGTIIYQVGTDGGFLDRPVSINSRYAKLLIAPSERADVIIDFTGCRGDVITMKNDANAPFPGGDPVDPRTTGQVMQFVVNGAMQGPDRSRIPSRLRPAPGLVKLTDFAGSLNVVPDKTRALTLVELEETGGPKMVLVNNTRWDGNGMDVPGLAVTEAPVEGSTEVWKFINLTEDAHPIHIHLIQFQLVSRQNFLKDEYESLYDASFPGGAMIGAYGPPYPYDYFYDSTNSSGWLGGNPDVTPYLDGPVNPANANERGWKDTFIMYPGMVTTVVARFAPTDLPLTAEPSSLVYSFDPSSGPGYVLHCHIFDHEDNEMMRPYTVAPSPIRSAGSLASVSGGKSGNVNPGMGLFNDDQAIALGQNSPNPFSDQSQFTFSLSAARHVQLKLYNSLGIEMETLIDQDLPSGKHLVRLDGGKLENGIYFYRLTAGNYSQTRRMIVIR